MSKPSPDADRIAELLAIPDPLERAAAITAYGRPRGNLPPRLAKRRMDDVAFGLALRDPAGRPVYTAERLAETVGFAKSGVFRLIRRLAPLQSSTEGATPC